MTFGDKLQSSRESQGLSQKELAGLVGVSTGVIAEWEANETTPDLVELSRLSKALGVSSDILLDAIAGVEANPVAQFKSTPAPVIPAPKNPRKIGWIIGVLVVGILAVVAVLMLGGLIGNRISQTEVTTAPTKPLAFAENPSAIELADASVVTIFCYNYDGELAATGSGFVAFDSLTIITNYHVMTSAYTCKISTNQDISYEVSKILCYSKEQDIAILQLAKDTGLQPLTLGDSSIIKKGETVVAIGSPLGIKNTVSTGNLSGRLMEDNMDVLQFTAPISSGSSGGALFDNNGNVIGITFASIVDGQNLNLAIPIELAAELYNKKGTAKRVSAICIEEHPYVQYLETHKNVITVTLEDLKRNPEKYNGRVVKLSTYISSYTLDLDNEDVAYLFASNKNDISFDHDYDWDRSYCVHFENHPLIEVRVHTCEEPPNGPIQEGKHIIIVGTFDYYPADPQYFPDGTPFYSTFYNDANIKAKYIDVSE